MRLKTRNLLALFLCLCMLTGSVCTVEAARSPQPKLTSLTFDVDYYYGTYSDLQAAIGYDYAGLLNHYLVYGLKEGRSGSAEFNCLAYKSNYADLQAAFGNDLSAYCTHYETYGRKEGRNAASAEGGQAVAAPAAEIAGNVIGTYTTSYNAEIPRATNVSLAAARINGVIIQPGGTFSFSKTILPRTAANGYVSAPVISGGKFVPGMGGGICQVSSTLYAAMLDADLPATERYPHSLKVDYIPEGMDATISGTAKDLKFTNTFEEPIQIVASAADGVLTVTITK